MFARVPAIFFANTMQVLALPCESGGEDVLVIETCRATCIAACGRLAYQRGCYGSFVNTELVPARDLSKRGSTRVDLGAGYYLQLYYGLRSACHVKIDAQFAPQESMGGRMSTKRKNRTRIASSGVRLHLHLHPCICLCIYCYYKCMGERWLRASASAWARTSSKQ